MSRHNPELPKIVWLNGRFLPASEAAISPFDRGFLYGDGAFETMRAEKGYALYLQDHIERLRGTLNALRISADPGMDWDALSRDLLRQNDLTGNTAAVKIIATRGIRPGSGLPHPTNPTLLLTAQRYTGPPPSAYRKGWRLALFRQGFAPPLSNHKSLNYLYFLVARQAAFDVEADEAVILDAHGRVTETSAGSLLVRSHGRWWTPDSPYMLPGITLHRISELLREEGSPVEARPATPDDLFSAEAICVLNSLIGIMPVSSVLDSHLLYDKNPATQDASRLRDLLFERGRRNL